MPEADAKSGDNCPMDIPKVSRASWEKFPDVVIVAEEKSVKAHPSYMSAKTGNAAAAKLLAAAFVDTRTLDGLRALADGRRVLFAPVHAIEAQGINRIPGVFAQLLAERLESDVAVDIIQANVVSHTGASGWQRMARPPIFDGPIRAASEYILVDDFVGQGGTLANLRGYLASGGGVITGAVTLTGKGYSAKLALEPSTLQHLRDKHGQQLETWWQQTFGYNLDRLTESEARYLLRAENFDTIRARLLEAGS